MRKNKFIIFGAALLLLFGFLLTKNIVQAGDEGDAIAVRIIPNPDHYSINEWYEKQGFTGSPQALIVDGYEAIRDGRTVYVGAANKKENLIYTNIYLISYNQSSSDQTVDILGQIVKKWKFNTDLENASTNFSCSVSSSACLSNTDCSTGQICATSGVASSSCQLTTAKNCLLDSDCPDNFFCDSIKSKIIRDLDRIGTVRDLNSSLDAYKNLNGFYPKLEAGTYITNYTVSVWPSWTETFLSELALNNFKDPINRLGACPGYDPITCWNKDTKKFVYSPQTNGLLLPSGSYGLVYKTDDKGSNYQLCSVMETNGLGYTFEPNSSLSSSCVENIGVASGGTFTNTAPQILDLYLVGEPNKEFNGSVKVVDAEGNPLSWSLNTSASAWTGWSAAPVLKDTNLPNVKKIYAAKAGLPGTYNLSLTVSDGQKSNATTTVTAPVTIITSAPLIEAEDAEFSPSSNNNVLNYSFYITDSNLVVPYSGFYWYKALNESSIPSDRVCAVKLKVNPQTGAVDCNTGSFIDPSLTTFFTGKIVYYTNTNKTPYCSTAACTTIAGSGDGIKCRWAEGTNPSWSNQCYIKASDKAPYSIDLISGPNNFSFSSSPYTFLLAGENRYKVDYQIPIATSTSLTADANSIFKITAWNSYSTSTKDVKITLKADNPSLIFNCQSSNRIGYPYACLLGPASQNGHIINYSSLTTLPAGLSINTVSSQTYLSGTSSAIFDNKIVIKIANEYSLAATSSLPLKINNYCGDGDKQLPNTENNGGLYNDGYEDCDGLGGVTDNATSSSITNQYGCMTGRDAITPFPILNNSYCVYKSPVEGGGYCGDGYCQVKVGDKLMENGCNCPSDCLGTMFCRGDGICTQTLNGVPAENACNSPEDCLSVMSCCGDGLVTGSETCDPQATPVVCTGTFSEGLPSYCDGIPLSGTKTCNSTCDGWGECAILAPVAVPKTFNANCNYGNDHPTDYACCELTSCVKDTCNCCGRKEGATISSGYTFIAGLSPCAGIHSVNAATPTVPGDVNSCKISQNNTNKRNWEVETNHTVAGYRCWK